QAELCPAVPVVADVVGHAGRVAVEVVDTEGEDVRPVDVVVGVEVERFEVLHLPGDVVARLVTRAVDGPGLEEQRPQLEAALDVDEPGAHVRLDRVLRVRGAGRASVFDLAALTELEEDRWVERERTRAPARVKTDRVTVLVLA